MFFLDLSLFLGGGPSPSLYFLHPTGRPLFLFTGVADDEGEAVDAGVSDMIDELEISHDAAGAGVDSTGSRGVSDFTFFFDFLTGVTLLVAGVSTLIGVSTITFLRLSASESLRMTLLTLLLWSRALLALGASRSMC